MAPAPKYLKMHYVKEEISDGKCESFSATRLKHVHHFCPVSLTAVLLLLSLSGNHLSPAGPPRVGVLPRHLRLSSSQSGSVLGQTLPAAARGPGADCQESGHLERRRGPIRSHMCQHMKNRHAPHSLVHSHNRRNSSSTQTAWINQLALLWSTSFKSSNMLLSWMTVALFYICI